MTKPDNYVIRKETCRVCEKCEIEYKKDHPKAYAQAVCPQCDSIFVLQEVTVQGIYGPQTTMATIRYEV